MLTTCPNCDYSLDGLPKRYACPECGFVYDKSMTPFEGIRKRPSLPFGLKLLILALGIAMNVYLQFEFPSARQSFFIFPNVLFLLLVWIAISEWTQPKRHAKLVLLGETGMVIVLMRGDSLRFDWTEIAHVKKLRLRSNVVIVGANNHPMATLHRRCFTTDWFAGRLIEQINSRAAGKG